MLDQKTNFPLMSKLLLMRHVTVCWSNKLLKAALDCTAVEKRVLYLISLWIKENYTSKHLNVPENWKDL